MLKWLVIGIGDITTKRVLPAILSEPRSRLAGFVTRDPQKAERYGVPAWTSVDTALKASDCDAIYVATPVFLHAPYTISSLQAAKHVLCEKPMAMNYAEACSMNAAAAESGRTLGIAYYRRTYPKVARALELVAAGAIGRPMFAEATSHEWFQPQRSARSWLADPSKSGGGPLFDIGSHRIDLMNYLFGEPQKAAGFMSNLGERIPVEDNATAMIEYRSGARVIVDVRWCSRVPQDEFRIRGTEGEIEMSPLNGPKLSYPGGLEEVPTHPNVHYPCIENFVSAVLDGAPLLSSGTTAAWTDWVTGQVLATCR